MYSYKNFIFSFLFFSLFYGSHSLFNLRSVFTSCYTKCTSHTYSMMFRLMFGGVSACVLFDIPIYYYDDFKCAIWFNQDFSSWRRFFFLFSLYYGYNGCIREYLCICDVIKSNDIRKLFHTWYLFEDIYFSKRCIHCTRFSLTSLKLATGLSSLVIITRIKKYKYCGLNVNNYTWFPI